jgi:rubrerythrin
MVSRVWSWKDLPDFLEEHGLTVNKFAEWIGLRQSTLRNVHTGHTKQPDPHVITAIEEGMHRVWRCDCCGTVFKEKPNVEPASKAKKEARKAT